MTGRTSQDDGKRGGIKGKRVSGKSRPGEVNGGGMNDKNEKRLDVHKDGKVESTLMNKFDKSYRLVGNTFEIKSRFVECVVSLCFITVSLLLRGGIKSVSSCPSC